MRTDERGQAIVIVVLAMGILLLGGLGLAIDGGTLYAHRTMAQAAADAAAEAGMLSIFNGTNTGSNAFASNTSYTHNCSTTDPITPCVYARNNGFGATASDTITVDTTVTAASIGLDSTTLAGVPVNLLRVTVRRNVKTGLMQMLGAGATMPVIAVAVAAEVEVVSPVPIIVLHPTLPSSFQKNGSNTITICGGPPRSIQVNSANSASIGISGVSGTVDLSHAGPKNTTPTACDGSGADLGNHGGPGTYPGTLLPGTDGAYRPNVSIIEDPLLSVAPPPQPTTAGNYVTATPGTHGCPAGLGVQCRIYSPGYYASGIDLGGSNKAFALFRPGIYYINHGGFHLSSNSVVRMAIGSDAVDPLPTTDPGYTGWTGGMILYNSPSTPVNQNKDIFEITANAGQINNITYPDATTGCPLGGNCLVGSPLSPYKYILFFQNRSTAKTLAHSLQGGGGLSITGTIYLTHTATSISADGTYQSLDLQGTSGSATRILGQIIVDTLSLGGTSDIVMTLRSDAIYTVRQIALVK
jgi:hypothetical protein